MRILDKSIAVLPVEMIHDKQISNACIRLYLFLYEYELEQQRITYNALSYEDKDTIYDLDILIRVSNKQLIENMGCSLQSIQKYLKELIEKDIIKITGKTIQRRITLLV